MEACDFWSIGSSDNQKILAIKQNLETKLNEELTYFSSETEMRNSLDLNFTQLKELRNNRFIDSNGYRYTIMYLPYFMINN